jgi:Rrf2 family protein
MIQVSKKVEYSIILIAYMAKNKEKTLSLSQAAKRLVLPYRFLGQLALLLKDGCILDSKEGKMGGYSLAADWDKKNLFDLVVALGENKRMVECMDGACPRKTGCGMLRIWNKIEKSFVNELKNIKLNEI